MAEGKKTDSKPDKEEEGRKVNPWIPIAVVAAIIALVAIMAAMSSSNNTGTSSNANQAASGTTQSGTDTSGAPEVDVSWLTLDTTPNQVVEKGGIPAKMLQQLISITDADMDKPFKDLGGQKTLDTVIGVVSQFGGGGMGGSGSGDAPSGMGGSGSSDAPSGMGGTTTP